MITEITVFVWSMISASIFYSELPKCQLSDNKVHRNKPGRLSEAEVITIPILFHCKSFRSLKHFHTQYAYKHLTYLFGYRLCRFDAVERLKFMFTHSNVDARQQL